MNIKTGLAIALFTTLLNANSVYAETGRWDTNATIISLSSDWKREKIAFSEGQPKQYSLGDRIWYTMNKNTLHFFKLIKPGQAATIAYMDIVEKGPHTLSDNELKDLIPIYEQTSEHTAQPLSGKVQSLGGRNVVVIDGSWSWRPCSQAYRGLKPGEKLNTNLTQFAFILAPFNRY